MSRKQIITLLVFIFTSIILLAAAWMIPGFSDFYVRYVYPIFIETYGRLTGFLPFSIGEIMLYLAVLYAALTLLLVILRIVMAITGHATFKLLNRGNLKVFVSLLAVILFIQTANCFIMYHTTPLYSDDERVSTYETTVEDLFKLREILVNRANELAPTFTRDDKGDIVYEGDLEKACISAMVNLGEMSETNLEMGRESALYKPLSRLKGYYSRPKPLYKSDFFSQQYIKGYFFPFSLEANYNTLMNVANFPDTFCHELSHLKGFIYEDEASFIASLACLYSGDEFVEYSGILNAIAYINIECDAELRADLSLADRLTVTPRSDYVKHDMTFVSDENWKIIEEDAVLSTEFTREASNTFLDTNLTVNGVSDGVESYSRIVDLLLKYYFGDNVAYDS